MAITPLQTTYNEVFDKYLKGMIPDMRTPARDFSRNVQNVDGIEFGTPVAQGTADRQCRPLKSGEGTKYLGFAVLDKTTTAEGKYLRYQAARIRNEGPIVVAASVAVAAGDSAYVVPATGAVTNVSAGNTLVGQFETSGGINALVVLNLR